MSLKTTPRGLLALLVALGIIMLQMPVVTGHAASAASAVAHLSAAPAHHAAAQHTAVKPHVAPHSNAQCAVTQSHLQAHAAQAHVQAHAALKPHVAPRSVNSLTETINGISLTPIAGPVGVPITVTGTGPVSATVPVTVSFTDSTGVVTPLTTTSTISPTGAFTAVTSIPLTVTAGGGSVNVNVNGATTSLPFTVNPATATPLSSSVTRCTPVTLTLDNFAPGIPITPTIVYTSEASTGGISTTALSPITPDATGFITPSLVVAIPSDVRYGTTGAISFTSSYPVTTAGGFPAFTVAVTPTFSITPTAVGAAGISQTLSLSSTSTGGFNIVGRPGITFSVGLSGTTPSVISPTALVTNAASGTFTATVQFTPTATGTYVITAADLGLCNQATQTFQVGVPAAPVSTQFLAEGYTGGSVTLAFHNLLNLLNPNPVSVIVTNTYLLQMSAAPNAITSTYTTSTAPDIVVVTHTLGAYADQVIDEATDIGSTPVITGPDVGRLVSGSGQRVATIIQTAGFTSNPSVRAVAVERVTERIAGTTFSDGDDLLATSNANTSYYFAEGYTGSSFQEYLNVFNPSPTLTATVNIVRAPEGAISTTLAPLGPYVIGPYQRVTLNMRLLNAGAPPAIGAIVNSDHPIVAEQSEYYGVGNGSSKPGMSNNQGLTTAAKQLDFAYGSLTGGYDIANPVTGTIKPASDLQQTIDDRPFITVMNPNIAGQVVAGTTSGTATAPGPSAHVTIQLRGEDGRLLGFFISDVDAGARFTLTYKDLTSSAGGIGFPGVPTASPTRAGVFSAVVSSSERVVSVLANYYGQGPITPSGDANVGAPGITLVGAPSGETDVVFPTLGASEAVMGKPISTTVFLYNPGVNPIAVTGAYFGATGVITSVVYTIGPDQIQVIGQNTTDVGGTGAGTATTTGLPIPAGTLGAEFSLTGERGSINGATSGEPGQSAEGFVAAAISHSADASNWWGTQGYYPLPTSCSTVTGCP